MFLNINIKTSRIKKNILYEHDVLSSHGLHRSTFGDGKLNYRVRNGIGWSLPPSSRSYKMFYMISSYLEGYIAFDDEYDSLNII